MRIENSSPELKRLIDAYNARQDELAVQLARGLIQSPDLVTRTKAKRILAHCLFEANSFEESASVYESLVQESDDPSDWLSVVTSSLMAKKFKEAESWLPRAREKIDEFVKTHPETPGLQAITVPKLLHYFAHAATDAGQPGLALAKIKELAGIYCLLKTTDDHLLLTRGVFALGSFGDLIAKVHPLTKDNAEWTGIFNQLESGLDDEGRNFIRDLKARLNGAPTSVDFLAGLLLSYRGSRPTEAEVLNRFAPKGYFKAGSKPVEGLPYLLDSVQFGILNIQSPINAVVTWRKDPAGGPVKEIRVTLGAFSRNVEYEEFLKRIPLNQGKPLPQGHPLGDIPHEHFFEENGSSLPKIIINTIALPDPAMFGKIGQIAILWE